MIFIVLTELSACANVSRQTFSLFAGYTDMQTSFVVYSVVFEHSKESTSL